MKVRGEGGSAVFKLTKGLSWTKSTFEKEWAGRDLYGYKRTHVGTKGLNFI